VSGTPAGDSHRDQEPVPFIALVACNACRRRRGAQRRRTGRVEQIPRHGTCPHGLPLRMLWADDQGPTAPPPP